MRKRDKGGVCGGERFLGFNKTLLWVVLQLLGEHDPKCKGLNQVGEEFTAEQTEDQRLGKMSIGVQERCSLMGCAKMPGKVKNLLKKQNCMI